MNFSDEGYDLSNVLRFVVSVESQFYPQMGGLYERRIEDWAGARAKELGLDDEEDDETWNRWPTLPESRASCEVQQRRPGHRANAARHRSAVAWAGKQSVQLAYGTSDQR
ncbi:MAG: hypothetical protein IPI73_18890 [Betaproteobacteria bacterium]|nr:hypothetical protein [Betaproteobacteria bacterium]